MKRLVAAAFALLLLSFAASAGGTNVSGAGTWGVPGGLLLESGAYLTSASDFDGTNDYVTRGADATGLADGKAGTLSLWIRVDGGDGANRRILATAAAAPRFQLLFAAANTISLSGRNAAGTLILNKLTADTYASGAVWYHILASWNLAAATSHLYVSNVAPSLAINTNTDDTIDYTQGNFSIGALTDGAEKFNGCIAELYFSPTYIDLSVAANRRRFISDTGKPVPLGWTGRLPTGTSAIIYHPDGNATERGTAGTWTVTGSLDACSTVPS